jgi:hypothetical protein
MRRLLLASSLCVVFAGCAAGNQWVKPDMTPSTRDADLEACSSEASHLSASDSMGIAIMDRCMAERGYQKKAPE